MPSSKFIREQWKFLPNFWYGLVTVLLFLLFVYLGFWQLGRMEFKQTLEMQHNLALQAKPTAFEAQKDLLLEPDYVKIFRYHLISVVGKLLNEKNILLDNQVLKGQPGYRVLSPLQAMGDDKLILLDTWLYPLGGR